MRPLSPASLNAVVLPRLLPAPWRGKDCVRWQPCSTYASGPAHHTTYDATPTSTTSTPASSMRGAASSAVLAMQPQEEGAGGAGAAPHPLDLAWLQGLWLWLAPRSDVTDISDWPLLPIKGGRLCLLRAQSTVGGGFGFRVKG